MSDHETRALLLEFRRLSNEVALMAEESRCLQRALLERSDRRAGLVLLPLVADLVDTSPFSAPQLLQAAIDSRTPTGQAVRELIVEAADGAGGMRAFGRLLQRLQGVPLSGFRLVSAGESREGLKWRLVRVSAE